jgi:hypothetical protein
VRFVDHDKYLRFAFFYRVWIGIKALLDLIEVARQAEDNSRVPRFLGQLEEASGIAE